MIVFAIPMILGNLLQQFYNLADTFIVGKFVGAGALAAVGSAYALMIFLNSVQLGLCMGSSVLFSIQYGKRDMAALRESIFVSFSGIGLFTLLIVYVVFEELDAILQLLQIPLDIYIQMRDYVWIVNWGMIFTFLYTFLASLLRSVGNSVIPLLFLCGSVILNILLDIWLICGANWGVTGAAWATVISQAFSASAMILYVWMKFPVLHLHKSECRFRWAVVREISIYSLLTCTQQSVMNLGILMVQGLVNSFGTVVMAAFAAAVKVDSFAYMPAQDFGNAFSTFIAQNFGAGCMQRIRTGVRSAVLITTGFCIFISLFVCLFAEPLMLIFIRPEEEEIIRIGVEYLRIEGSCYVGIGCLFLFYGYYRAIQKPGMSVVLTVVSLGVRVMLAYLFASIPEIGISGIWWSIPIGWLLADLVGWGYFKYLSCSSKHIL